MYRYSNDNFFRIFRRIKSYIFSRKKNSNKDIKTVLIVTRNFSGGGLEKRINFIVEKFYKKYNFNLITETSPRKMKIKPSPKFQKIYKWKKMETAIQDADILDLHPFNAQYAFNILDYKNKKVIIYTIHGEVSVEDGMNNFLPYLDRICVVSKLLKPMLLKKYPNLENKIFLSKNLYRIEAKEKAFDPQKIKDVLVILTNVYDWDYLKNIILNISDEYKIHFIGYMNEQFDLTIFNNAVYDGFVNVKKYLDTHQFSFAFSRGGYAAMDLIERNIPLILIYNRENNTYLEMLNHSNFEELSDSNFVTWTLFDKQYFLNSLTDLKNNRKFYECRNKLIKYNNIDDMEDPYLIENEKQEFQTA